MSDTWGRAAALVALAGAGVAGYLFWARSTGSGLTCTTGGCETVQSSEYAELLGVPVAALGLFAFVAIGILSLLPGLVARAVAAALALAAVLFAGYLLTVQLAVIGAVCDWCLASDAIASLLAALTLLRLREGLLGSAETPSVFRRSAIR